METFTNKLDSNIEEKQGGILNTEIIRVNKVEAVKLNYLSHLEFIIDTEEHDILYENEYIQSNLNEYGHLDTNNYVKLNIHDYLENTVDIAYEYTYDNETDEYIILTEKEVEYLSNDKQMNNQFCIAHNYLEDYLIKRYSSQKYHKLFEDIDSIFDSFIEEFHKEKSETIYFEILPNEVCDITTFQEVYIDYYGDKYLDIEEFIHDTYNDYDYSTIKEEYIQEFERNKIKIINMLKEEHKRHQISINTHP